MTNKERIVELLNNYISENKVLKEEYKDLEIKISLFNEVLTYLDMDYTNMKEHSLNIDILLNSITIMITVIYSINIYIRC